MSAASPAFLTRPPIVDGLFYPARRDALATQVDGLLSRCPTPRAARFALIVPHAGYEYAGEVMAAGYRSIALRPVRTAVLIGPVHRDPEPGIFLPESASFATPLGPVPVDAAAIASLESADPLFRRWDIPHLEEHCLELQLPFLMRLFPGLSIVPLLVGGADGRTAAALGRGLRLTFGEASDYTVFIVSANMSSYMTGRDAAAEAALIERILGQGDWRGLISAAGKRAVSACGVAGMAAVLELAGEGCRVEVLARAASREREGDDSRVVHYAAVAVDAGARVRG
jgi:MEMO1 family protein